MLAHNSVDRGFMARDSIELNLDEQTRFPGKPTRARASIQNSTLSDQPVQERRARVRPRIGSNQDDSELLINSDDLDLDEVENEEARFLRADKRVPVRRGPLPKKAVHWLKLGGLIAAVLVLCAILVTIAGDYARHAALFRVQSSDSVEITGVHNASLVHIRDVAASEVIARNIFSVDLDERRQKLEQIPWVEQATVMRLLPNRIWVTIAERIPVAFAQIGSRVSLIDANGVVMGMPADRKTKYSFPVIQGIAETEPLSSRAAAMKIYNRLVGELDSPDAAGKSPGFVQQLSEVDLADPEDVKVTANDPGGTMVVHLGPGDFLPRYKLYVGHIAEWRQQFPNLQSVDLRYDGQVVVNPDKPTAQPKKSSPLMNTDNTDKKKQVAKATAKPVSAKVAAKPATAKPVAKAAGHKVAKKKSPPKKAPQRTQSAQR